MPAPQRKHEPQRGSILLAVLVLVAVMTLGGLSYFNWTNSERRATRAFIQQSQAFAAAESGAGFLQVYLDDEPSALQQDGGVYDNPSRFRGLLLLDSDAAALRTRLSFVAPGMDTFGVYEGHRFGLEDESSRINLNTILFADDHAENGARQMLLGLPGVTESIADAILDWIDEDDEPRDFGAEASYYSSLDPPYAPANRPLESIDQLLLVRDVTESLLYGLDRDRNYSVDSQEALGVLASGVDNSDGAGDRGLAAYLTLFSAQRNVDTDGNPRIDVNQEDLEQLHAAVDQALGTDAANFIVAFRQGGPEASDSSLGADFDGDTGGDLGSSSSGSPKPAGQIEIDFEVPGNEKISSVFSLVGVNTSTTTLGDDQKVVVETPFPDDPGQMASYLPDLLNYLTVSSAEVIPGKVNVNQAPRRVLEGLPGMPPEAVDLILSTRTLDDSSSQPGRRTAAWLMTQGVLGIESMRELAPFVSGDGDVYRTQVVGFFDEGGASARLELIVDATEEFPVLRQRRELTPLGRGFSIETVGAEAIAAP